MNFPQNIYVALMNRYNAGGFAHVPPTVCLLPVRVSAYAPANVERTGKAGTNKSGDLRIVRPVAVNSLILFLGLIA